MLSGANLPVWMGSAAVTQGHHRWRQIQRNKALGLILPGGSAPDGRAPAARLFMLMALAPAHSAPDNDVRASSRGSWQLVGGANGEEPPPPGVRETDVPGPPPPTSSWLRSICTAESDRE